MSGFTVTSKDIDDKRVLSLFGFLDAHTAPQFEAEIEHAMHEKKVKLIINLAKLDYISSAGLGVFMGYVEDIRSDGGDIIISSASDKVYKVFDLLGFPNIFKIVPTEEEALNQFKL
jgi:anti-sigma B factor antagonist